MQPLKLALGALIVFGCSGMAAADSIHMKTGAVIRTDKATIEGDAVVFEQYGSRVAIPLTLVERVVPDDHPLLVYYRWFWRDGDGWNPLHSQVESEELRLVTGR